MSITYLRSRVSMMLDVRPVSSTDRGSAGRKASSFKIDASRPPPPVRPAVPVDELPETVPTDIKGTLRRTGKSGPRGRRGPPGKHRLGYALQPEANLPPGHGRAS